MVLSPHDFTLGWGDDALVRLPTDMPASIPCSALAFLTQAGLPALIRYRAASTNGVITFCRLATGLAPVLDEVTDVSRLAKEWAGYWIIGDEFFCNGSAWWCIHEQSEEICRIDIELEDSIEFVNCSAAHFASAALVVVSWSSRQSMSAEEWPAQVDQLKLQIAAVDPASMASERNFWPSYLNFMRDEGPQVGLFEKGSRFDGEQALLAGPW